MTKQEQIEEMAKTLSEYEINELTVEKDLAEFLYNAGYKQEKEVAKEILQALWKEIWNDVRAEVAIEYLADEYGIDVE